MLSPTDVAELAATAAPVLQLVLQRPLALLQAELVEGLAADLTIHKLQGGEGGFSKSEAALKSPASPSRSGLL